MLEKMSEKFSISKHFKIFGTISIILVAAGLIAAILLPFGKSLFNLGIDFVGGTTMRISMHTQMTAEEQNHIKAVIQDTVNMTAITQKSGDGTEILIQTLSMNTQQRQDVFAVLADEYSLESGDLIESVDIDTVVGKDMQTAAITASLLAILLILIYVSIRFEFKSGVAAVIALVHDIFVMLSVYIIFQIPLNMNFIAAALTILGYSINSTIIVFDRIREGAKLNVKLPFEDIADKSIWLTMSRSINTTVTTLFPIILLLIFGVDSIRNFALPLMIGIISGAYSSVFISGPIWVRLKGMGKKPGAAMKKKKA